MKVRVIRPITIDGIKYEPSPEILHVWPSEARKGIMSGQLEDVEGNFAAAIRASREAKIKIEKRKIRKENNDGNTTRTV